MKHHDCPKCGNYCQNYVSGNPDSQTYFLCPNCNIAFYWLNPKRVMFSTDDVRFGDELYIHVNNVIGFKKQEYRFVLS